LKTAKEGSDLAVLKTASEALSAEISKIGEHLAKAAQQTPPGAQNNQGPSNNNQTGGTDGKGPEGPEGNVTDADFKEKK
jgi:hypothetical protein